MKFGRLRRYRHVGAVEFEVEFQVGVGGQRAAAIGACDAAEALALASAAFLVGNVKPHQSNVIAPEDIQKVDKPSARIDQVIGDDVDPFVQEDLDGPITGVHRIALSNSGPGVTLSHSRPSASTVSSDV